MKFAILGQEGYIGTALTKYLKENNHEVVGIDNGLRKSNVLSVGSDSLTEKEHVGAEKISVLDFSSLKIFLEKERPDAVVHLAEQPSAPFSMKSPHHAYRTQENNVLGTLNVLYAIKEVNPKIHLIKLGTEGEYPDWLWDGKHIPEGNRMEVFLPNNSKSVKKEKMCHPDHAFYRWEIPTPRYAGSWYHFSKLHDSMNIDYACRVWGLRATDVNQGIVYGNINNTRLDIDYYFGTVVNRFIAQAVSGHPLTIYGTGGQTRGFINLRNSIEAIKLLAENPAKEGEFRVIHQTTEEKSVMEIAEMVKELTDCKIKKIKNPRAEMDSNKFTFDNSTLKDLGLGVITMEDELPKLLKTVEENKSKIRKEIIMPEGHAKWK